MDLWTYERELWAEGYERVCGCDEAGAGPLAGPVYAAAVILPRECDIPGLNDSKKLSEARRETLYSLITATAEAWSVARVEAAEIDATDILSARMKAMQLAIDGLSVRPDVALIDGNRDKGRSASIVTPHRTLVKGDGKSASVAAASILAKVSRDRYVCEELDALYPQYGFAKHKGYGTKLHYEMLDRYGPCPAHRKSYLKTWEARTPKTLGDYGESVAADALTARGFTILERQWRCPYGELDLIARDPSGTVCFVEVKLRNYRSVALPREFVDRRKREKLRKTALYWLSLHEPDAPSRFDVADILVDPDGRPRLSYLQDAFT